MEPVARDPKYANGPGPIAMPSGWKPSGREKALGNRSTAVDAAPAGGASTTVSPNAAATRPTAIRMRRFIGGCPPFDCAGPRRGTTRGGPAQRSTLVDVELSGASRVPGRRYG